MTCPDGGGGGGGVGSGSGSGAGGGGGWTAWLITSVTDTGIESPRLLATVTMAA
jgi:hypothetical protein